MSGTYSSGRNQFRKVAGRENQMERQCWENQEFQLDKREWENRIPGDAEENGKQDFEQGRRERETGFPAG